MNETAEQQDGTSGQSNAMRIRYEKSVALLASQFVLNVTENGILLDCSSGPIVDETTREPVLPIHTRIAIPQASVRRLQQLLTHLTTRSESSQPTDESLARLPKLATTDA